MMAILVVLTSFPSGNNIRGPRRTAKTFQAIVFRIRMHPDAFFGSTLMHLCAGKVQCVRGELSCL